MSVCKICAGESLKIVGGKTAFRNCDECWYDRCDCRKAGHDKEKIPPLPPMSVELQNGLLQLEKIMEQPTKHIISDPFWWDWSKDLIEEFLGNVIWKFRLTVDDLKRIHTDNKREKRET